MKQLVNTRPCRCQNLQTPQKVIHPRGHPIRTIKPFSSCGHPCVAGIRVCSRSGGVGTSSFRLQHSRGRQGSICAAGTSDTGPLLSWDEVQAVAKQKGLCIYTRTFGPSWRVVCRDGSEDGPIRGVVTGWIVPFTGILHCETLQVFTRGMRGPEGNRLRGGPLGLGLLMGGATFTFGYSKGCTKAEILAINDDDHTHAKLVKYYKYFGFVPVREVEGSGLGDVIDMMAWGGAGTRMDADIVSMLRRWTPAFRSKLTGQQQPDAVGSQQDSDAKVEVPAGQVE